MKLVVRRTKRALRTGFGEGEGERGRARVVSASMASHRPLFRACKTCLFSTPPRPHLRSFSTRPSPPDVPPPPPPPSAQSTTFSPDAPPKGPHPSVAASHSLLNVLRESTRTRARAFSRAVEALELERKLRDMGGKINQATGYEEIELLRVDVASRGA